MLIQPDGSGSNSSGGAATVVSASGQNSLARFHSPATLALLILVAVSLHYFVLSYIFPGYYRPLAPHHSDFYMPAHRAAAEASLFDLLKAPRPVGTLYMSFIGRAGIEGSIALVLVTVFVALGLFAMAIRNRLQITSSIGLALCFGLYAFLVFAHPYFYTFSTWDFLANLSLAFIGAGLWSYSALEAKKPNLATLALGISMLLAFLSKETFALSMIPIAAAFATSWRRAIVSAGVTFACFVASFGYNLAMKSPFVSGTPGSPYEISLSPSSIATMIIRQMGDGYSFTIAIIVAAGSIISFLAWRADKLQAALLGAALVVGGLAAFIPPALLPQHYFSGYSFPPAYLLFAPVLLLAIPGVFSLSIRCVAVAGLFLPLLWMGLYKQNWWILEQEVRQQNLMAAMRFFAQQPNVQTGAKSILVTGIDFPFSPMDYGLAIRQWLPNREARFTVVDYSENGGRGRSGGPTVTFADPETSKHGHYDAVWAFRSDGTGMFAEIPISDESSVPRARITIVPGDMRVCDPPVVATILWDARSINVNEASITVAAQGATPTLFANVAGEGSLQTGPWSVAGTTFNLTDRQGSRSLASVTITPKPCGADEP